MNSVTTSVRIKSRLRQELEWLSSHSGRGINWIIEQAVEEYFERQKKNLLLEEAIKDVIFLQSRSEHEDTWQQLHDDTDWVV
jgi:predicted DNA-binding protein